MKKTFWISNHFGCGDNNENDRLIFVGLGVLGDARSLTVFVVPLSIKEQCYNEHDKDNLTSMLRDNGAKNHRRNMRVFVVNVTTGASRY